MTTLNATHGTRSAYERGCRCSECKAAKSRYMAAYRRTGSGPLVTGLFDSQPWADDAACVGRDPTLFFPERGEDTRAAKAVCRDCPVRKECLDYALEHRIIYGIWGGLAERERRRIRTQRAKAARMEQEARTW
jgi:WhiB family redox-sensing transcriptional regulator